MQARADDTPDDFDRAATALFNQETHDRQVLEAELDAVADDAKILAHYYRTLVNADVPEKYAQDFTARWQMQYLKDRAAS
jgi:hypothetical protein